ncbi:hypothetical protein QOT17_023448 [Balamuthia mandrillaris]
MIVTQYPSAAFPAEQKETTFIPTERRSFTYSDAIDFELQANDTSSPNSGSQSLSEEAPVIKMHFGPTGSWREFPITEYETSYILETFYDTKDHLLTKKNYWLKYYRKGSEQERWVLKRCAQTKRSASGDNVTCSVLEEEAAILEQLALLLGHKEKSVGKFEELWPFATLESCRYTPKNSSTLTGNTYYWDLVRFQPQHWRLLGVLCVKRETSVEAITAANLLPASATRMGIIAPVRSKIVEYLFQYKKDWYDELVHEGVVPERNYHQLPLCEQYPFAIGCWRPPYEEEGYLSWEQRIEAYEEMVNASEDCLAPKYFHHLKKHYKHMVRWGNISMADDDLRDCF